jgi:hypothetical protein
VALVTTEVSQELIASIIRKNGIIELGACILQLLVPANVAPSSLILFALNMETIRSYETPVIASATRRHIPKDGLLQFLSLSRNG